MKLLKFTDTEDPDSWAGRLICGDNVAVLSQLENSCVDLVVTSPPYDNLRTYGNHTWDFEQLAFQLHRILRPGGVIVWVVADAHIDGKETLTSFRQAIYFDHIGLRMHDSMVYEKSGPSFPDSTRYLQVAEWVWVMSKGKPKHVNLLRDRPNKYVGKTGGNRRGGLCNRAAEGIRFNIWRYATGGGNSSKDPLAFRHPAIMPEGLARDHILSWSREGDVVLDPFAGSGTTLIQAAQLNRKFFGVEVHLPYYRLAKQRLEKI